MNIEITQGGETWADVLAEVVADLGLSPQLADEIERTIENGGTYHGGGWSIRRCHRDLPRNQARQRVIDRLTAWAGEQRKGGATAEAEEAMALAREVARRHRLSYQPA